METTVLQRIRSIIDYLNISDSNFAKTIGVPVTTINNYFVRQREPSLLVVQSILNSIEWIDISWLLLGKGKMFKKVEGTKSPENNSTIEMLKMISELSAENALLKKELENLKEDSSYNIAASGVQKYGNE